MSGYHSATVTRCDSRTAFGACPCYGYSAAGEPFGACPCSCYNATAGEGGLYNTVCPDRVFTQGEQQIT